MRADSSFFPVRLTGGFDLIILTVVINSELFPVSSKFDNFLDILV